jgi:putative flippase GtrA
MMNEHLYGGPPGRRPASTSASWHFAVTPASGTWTSRADLEVRRTFLLRRWLKFNTVGAIGIAVQLAALWLLAGPLHIQYLWATALAVETAVLHNFVWHERWTWKGRGERKDVLLRLLRFNLTTGALSILSNLICMKLLVGQLRMRYMIANLLAIAVTSVANFLVSEWFVFR